MPHLEPPEDSNITTLYCGGLDETVTEQDIKNAFYAFGEIRNITLVTKQVNTIGQGDFLHGDDEDNVLSHADNDDVAGLRLRPVHPAEVGGEGRGGDFQQAAD